MVCEEMLLEALPKRVLNGQKKTIWNWPRASTKRVSPTWQGRTPAQIELGWLHKIG